MSILVQQENPAMGVLVEEILKTVSWKIWMEKVKKMEWKKWHSSKNGFHVISNFKCSI